MKPERALQGVRLKAHSRLKRVASAGAGPGADPWRSQQRQRRAPDRPSPGKVAKYTSTPQLARAAAEERTAEASADDSADDDSADDDGDNGVLAGGWSDSDDESDSDGSNADPGYGFDPNVAAAFYGNRAALATLAHERTKFIDSLR